jgi:hypothetical protein
VCFLLCGFGCWILKRGDKKTDYGGDGFVGNIIMGYENKQGNWKEL